MWHENDQRCHTINAHCCAAALIESEKESEKQKTKKKIKTRREWRLRQFTAYFERDAKTNEFHQNETLEVEKKSK